MTVRTSAAVAAAMLWLAGAAGAEEHRELGPHEHGHGTLNIAFEGGRVTMELEAPGMDLLGFEHEARSDADKATLDKVTAALKNPLALFKMPPAAGCKVSDAKVEMGDDDETAAGKPAAADGKPAAQADAHQGEHDHGPNDTIHGNYELSCASLAGITAIDFDYFKAFAGAKSLTVTIVTPRAQSAFEVSRDKPVLDLGKLM